MTAESEQRAKRCCLRWGMAWAGMVVVCMLETRVIVGQMSDLVIAHRQLQEAEKLSATRANALAECGARSVNEVRQAMARCELERHYTDVFIRRFCTPAEGNYVRNRALDARFQPSEKVKSCGP